jgi:hypothetical protein
VQSLFGTDPTPFGGYLIQLAKQLPDGFEILVKLLVERVFRSIKSSYNIISS